MIAALVIVGALALVFGVVAFVFYQRAQAAEAAAQNQGSGLAGLIRTFGPLLALI